MKPLLDLHLSVDLAGKPQVLRNVALQLYAGEVVGLVGESGSGKSTLALSIMRLLPARASAVRGTLEFSGCDVLKLKESEVRAMRGRDIAMVLQSPLAALNPALRIGAQMAEAWRAHDKKNARGWRDRALESCERVALPNAAELLERYPRQLSVGQAQRILIAMAILHRPRLLIADEPTSALDAITSAEILALFKNLRRELNMAMLFISHDLLSVSSLCDRLVILRHGEIVETGATAQIFQHPTHEYTRALVNAVPPHPLMMPSGLIALSRFTQQQPPNRALPAGDVLTTAETTIGRR